MTDRKTGVAGYALDAYRTTGSSPTGLDAYRPTGSSPTIAAAIGFAAPLPRPTSPSPLVGLEPRSSGIANLPDIALEYGAVLRGGRLTWRCHGPEGAPAVLVLGGISAGRDVVAVAGDGPGWWTPFVGPGRAVDTERFRVIGIDYIGGRGDSTTAGELPAPDGSRHGDMGAHTCNAEVRIDSAHARDSEAPGGAAHSREAFEAASPTSRGLPGGPAQGEPLFSPRDQAAAIAALLGVLGIPSLHACVGASYGGMVALALAATFPARVGRLVLLGAAHEPHPMATALRALQRSIVRRGIANGDAREALILARALGVTTYRTAREFAARFGPMLPIDPRVGNERTAPTGTPRYAAASVEGYLRAQGERFADRFTPESYLCLSQSIDLHHVDPATVFAPVTCIAFEPDAIAPVWQARALTAGLRGPWSLRVLPSIYGHDAFLKEVEAITPIVADALTRPEVSR